MAVRFIFIVEVQFVLYVQRKAFYVYECLIYACPCENLFFEFGGGDVKFHTEQS